MKITNIIRKSPFLLAFDDGSNRYHFLHNSSKRLDGFLRKYGERIEGQMTWKQVLWLWWKFKILGK